MLQRLQQLMVQGDVPPALRVNVCGILLNIVEVKPQTLPKSKLCDQVSFS